MTFSLGLVGGVSGRVNCELARVRQYLLMNRLKGIIHVGANLAQECGYYERFGLNVLWIEPNLEIFNQLKIIIAPYVRQRSLQYLVLDEDHKKSTLHITNDSGGSSSVLSMAQFRDVWSSINVIRDVEMLAYKLDTIVEKEAVDLSNYDGLVLDTEGSELLILKGARNVLQTMKMVKIEVADFEVRSGCPRPEQIAEILKEYDLHERWRVPHRERHPDGGQVYDITYLRGRNLA
jgi:FkbM family methyltransferase